MDADERDRLGEKLWCAIGLRWPWRSVEEWHREQYRIAAEAVLAAAPPWRPTEDDLAEIADRLTDGMCLERWGSRLVRETVAGQLLQQLATLGYLRRPPAPDSGNAEGSA